MLYVHYIALQWQEKASGSTIEEQWIEYCVVLFKYIQVCIGNHPLDDPRSWIPDFSVMENQDTQAEVKQGEDCSLT